MKLIGYYRGGPRSAGRSLIDGYAERNGLEPELVISDEPGAYGGMRKLQNAAKLAYGCAVLLPSYSDLGDDRYMRLENELFFLRNGLSPIFADGSGRDPLHDLVSAAYLYFGSAEKEFADHGLLMPFGSSEENGTKLPFGYRMGKKGIEKDRAFAPVVCLVFELFTAGESVSAIRDKVNSIVKGRRASFTNMTVYSVLRNHRYLGLRSKKGAALPALITCDKWFSARERDPIPERELDADLMLKEALISVRCDNALTANDKETLINSAVETAVACAASCDVEKLYSEYVIPELEMALSSEPEAEHDLKLAERGLRRDLKALVSGERSEKLQARCERRADEKVMLSRRLRRIRTEAELFSIKKEQMEAFVKRAAMTDKLSAEERAFLLPAFVKRIEVKEGAAILTFLDTADGKIKRKSLKP